VSVGFFFVAVYKKKKKSAPGGGPGGGAPPVVLLGGGGGGGGGRTFSTQKNQQQPQRTFSNRVLRWPISAAILTIDVARERSEKRRTSTRVPFDRFMIEGKKRIFEN